MSLPTQIKGGGNNSTAQNVIRVTFSEALDAPPTLEAWDDFNFNTVAGEMFTGTTVNANKPQLAAVATTDAAPTSNWFPVNAVAGGAVINRLKGSTNYVNLSTGTPAADESILFNMAWELASDNAVPSVLNGLIMIKLSYSGAAPVLTWEINDNEGGGTEGTPVWTTYSSGSGGDTFRSADIGSTVSNISLHRPQSGVLTNFELWAV